MITFPAKCLYFHYIFALSQPQFCHLLSLVSQKLQVKLTFLVCKIFRYGKNSEWVGVLYGVELLKKIIWATWGRVMMTVFLPSNDDRISFIFQVVNFHGKVLLFVWLWLNFAPLPLTCRPQSAELKARGGPADLDTSKMADMSVEDITLRANHVTDEVCLSSITIAV